MKRSMAVTISKFTSYSALSSSVASSDSYMSCKNETMYSYSSFVNNSAASATADVANKLCRFNCGGKS